VTVLDLETRLPKDTIHDASFNQPYRIGISKHFAYVCNSNSPSVAGQSGTVSIIDLKTNKVTGTINGFDGPGGVVLSHNKKLAYVTNYGAPAGVQSGNGNTVSVVDLKSNTITDTIVVDQAPSALTLSDCGCFLYVTCYVDGNPGTGTLVVIKTKNNKVVTKIAGLFGPFGLVVTKNNKYVYVTNFGSNNFAPFGTSVSVIHLKKQKIVKQIQTGVQPAGIAISPCNQLVYVSNYNALYANPVTFQDLTYGEGTVSVICTKTKTLVSKTIPVGQTPSTLTLSKDGKTLYVCKYVQNTILALNLNDILN